MINANWPVWITKAIYQQFSALNPFLEGQVRTTEGKDDWIELNVSGPDFEEQTKGHFKVTVRLDFLIVSIINKDVYRHATAVGTVLEKLVPIVVEDDSHNPVSCLTVARNERGTVVTVNIGQISPKAQYQRTDVAVDYVCQLEGDD